MSAGAVVLMVFVHIVAVVAAFLCGVLVGVDSCEG
jgi:hypothetical protein